MSNNEPESDLYSNNTNDELYEVLNEFDSRQKLNEISEILNQIHYMEGC